MRVSVYVYTYLMQKRGIADTDVGLPHSIHRVSCQSLRLRWHMYIQSNIVLKLARYGYFC